MKAHPRRPSPLVLAALLAAFALPGDHARIVKRRKSNPRIGPAFVRPVVPFHRALDSFDRVGHQITAGRQIGDQLRVARIVQRLLDRRGCVLLSGWIREVGRLGDIEEAQRGEPRIAVTRDRLPARFLHFRLRADGFVGDRIGVKSGNARGAQCEEQEKTAGEVDEIHCESPR